MEKNRFEERAHSRVWAYRQTFCTENAELMHAGPASQVPGTAESARVTGMTQADIAEATATPGSASVAVVAEESGADSMAGMSMKHGGVAAATTMHTSGSSTAQTTAAANSQQGLNGCLTLQADGKAMLKLLNSSRIYRLEGRALRFSENANRLVHVSGRSGSIMAVEDPNLPSFVVDTVDQLAPNCSAKISAADIRKALIKTVAAVPNGTVRMGDMGFIPATITVNAGDKVTWTNSSQVFHNVVDDASKAVSPLDVSFPSGGRPFDSGLMQPGQSFSRVFAVPGVYHYVCTLHEGNGMKGVVIVKPAPVLAASK